MYFGGIAANQDFWSTLPEPVQAAFRQAGRVTSDLHGDYVAQLNARAFTEMQAAGLKVADLPEADKQAWVEGLPNIVEPWLAQTGEAGRTVLRAYFDALRAAGVTPLRDWDAGL
jgi:TRAP-type C4-dicarboxylate transport system substrate-binding protein